MSEILEVQGERPEKDSGSLACIKADEKKLDDIRVVRDFPGSAWLFSKIDLRFWISSVECTEKKIIPEK
ncbi:hypothetical protein Tco_1378619 [Tanacetum coccineum]